MVLLTRVVASVNVAVVPLTVTVPDTGVEPFIRVNEATVTVAGSIGLLKVAVMAVLIATEVAKLTGLVVDTVGGVVSGAEVLNVHE